MKFFTYDGDFGIYDNPYFIMIFFAVMFGFFIFFLIKSDNKEANRQKNSNINDSIQKLEFDKADIHDIPEMPYKADISYKTDKPERNEALEIIKIRYAKGEIDEEEFEKIKSAVM